MTPLMLVMLGLAIVVVVVLVLVIIAARNMRAEDPDEFAGRRGSGRPGSGHDDRARRLPDRRAARQARGPGGERGDGDGARRPGTARSGARLPGARPGQDIDDRPRQPRPRGYDDRPAQQWQPEYPARTADRAGAPRQQARTPSQPTVRAAARKSASRRPSDSSEWSSSEWDKLSDVDYWAELAADKPLTTSAQPAAPRGRTKEGRDRENGSGLPPKGSTPPARDLPQRDAEVAVPPRSQPPARSAAGHVDFIPAPVTSSWQQGSGTSPEGRPRRPSAADPARRDPAGRPVPLDDDPLTSPSFPRVPAAPDSRSYRAHSGLADRASDYDQVRQRGRRGRDDRAELPGSGLPTAAQQLPSAAPQYRHDARPPASTISGPLPVSPGLRAPAPSGNPYGSYVAAPVNGSFGDTGGYPTGPGAGGDPYSRSRSASQAPAVYPGPSGWQPASGAASYQAAPWPAETSAHQASAGDYQNGTWHHDPADYLTQDYRAVSQETASYRPEGQRDPRHGRAAYDPADPYPGDRYGAHPGYPAGGS